MMQPIQSTLSLPTPDWRTFAAALRASLITPAVLWATTALPVPVSPEDTAADPRTPLTGTGGTTGNSDATGDAGAPVAAAGNAEQTTDQSTASVNEWGLDGLLDWIEQEDVNGFIPLPPVPDDAGAAGKAALRHRLRLATAMAVLRLAKTFGSAEAMCEALGTTGRVTLLITGVPELDETLQTLIQHVTVRTSSGPSMRRIRRS